MELILAHGEDAVGCVERVGIRAAIAVDLVPIAHLQAVERVPKHEIVENGGHVGPVPGRGRPRDNERPGRAAGSAPRLDVHGIYEKYWNFRALRLSRARRRPRAGEPRRGRSAIPCGSGRPRPSAPLPHYRHTRRASAPRRWRTAWLRPWSGTVRIPGR